MSLSIQLAIVALILVVISGISSIVFLTCGYTLKERLSYAVYACWNAALLALLLSSILQLKGL